MASEDLDMDVSKAAAAQNNKMIIIVAAIFSMITLLAVGLTIFFLKGANPPAAGEHAEAAEKKEESVHLVPVKYVEIKPAFLINFVTKPKIRYLQIEVSIMVKGNDEEAEIVKSQLPLIKNNLDAIFSSNSFDDVVLSTGREKMRMQALEEVKKIIKERTGKSNIENVLFTSFVVQ